MTVSDPGARRAEHADVEPLLQRIPRHQRTDAKVANLLLAMEEFHRGEIVLRSMPYRIIMDPTNTCNLHCPLCSTGNGSSNRRRGRMTMAGYLRVLDQVCDCALELFLNNWGESTLHPDLPAMIAAASTRGIHTYLSTNFSRTYTDGYLRALLDSGLGVLQVDVDGTTQEVYGLYRKNGELDLVIRNLEDAVAVKRSSGSIHTRICAVMLAHRHNEHQVEDFKKWMTELGVDESHVGRLQVSPHLAKDWLPENPALRYNNYLEEPHPSEQRPCARLWGELALNWDGQASPCCVVDDAEADFGALLGDRAVSVRELWNNEFYRSARQVFLGQNESPPTICHVCRNQLWSRRLQHPGGGSFSICL